MAKDPAFLWYPGDYIAGTTEYTFEEKGAYVEILMKQFEHGGPLPEEKIKRILRESYSRIWAVISEKFKQDENGNWFNERLEKERTKRKNFTESRRKNLEGKAHKDDDTEHHITPQVNDHTADRMENENRNINVIIDYKESAKNFDSEIGELSDKVSVIEAVFNDEIFISDIQMTHRGKDIRQAFNECYIHHSNAPNPPRDVAGWKRKLNTWLSNTKNGTSKKGEVGINARREGFAKRYGTDAGG